MLSSRFSGCFDLHGCYMLCCLHVSVCIARDMVISNLGAKPLVLQVPIGAEDAFQVGG